MANDQFGTGNHDSSLIETLYLYGGRVVLEYDPVLHAYYRVVGEERHLCSGVTSVCGMLDKSAALKQWTANLTAEYILRHIPVPNELVRVELETLYGIYKANGTPPARPRSVISVPTDDLAKLAKEARLEHNNVTKDAASVGKVAHEWLERYIKAKIAGGGVEHSEPLPSDPRSASCVKAALGFFDRHKVEFVFSERKIYSEQYGYSGTMDLLAWVTACEDKKCCPFDGRVLELLDFKTSNGMRVEYLMQTAAYKRALLEEFEDMHICHRRIMKLGKEDGDFENRVLPADTFEDDFQAFVGALLLFNWSEQPKIDRAQARHLKKLAKGGSVGVKPIKVSNVKFEEIPIEPEAPKKRTRTTTKKTVAGIEVAV